ncbi:MAG: hypothetical protein ACOC6Q_03100 [Patescibacteria group bacterium]
MNSPNSNLNNKVHPVQQLPLTTLFVIVATGLIAVLFPILPTTTTISENKVLAASCNTASDCADCEACWEGECIECPPASVCVNGKCSTTAYCEQQGYEIPEGKYTFICVPEGTPCTYYETTYCGSGDEDSPLDTCTYGCEAFDTGLSRNGEDCYTFCFHTEPCDCDYGTYDTDDENTQTCCDTGCTNTDTDPENCGSCGNVCLSDESCQEGTCTVSVTFKDIIDQYGTKDQTTDFNEDKIVNGRDFAEKIKLETLRNSSD